LLCSGCREAGRGTRPAAAGAGTFSRQAPKPEALPRGPAAHLRDVAAVRRGALQHGA
jgi:hypothetical protein